MGVLHRQTVALLLGLTAVVARADETTELSSAREHYRMAAKLYDLGRYLEAAKEYEAAYLAKEDTAFLFNMAQAYRLGGDYANALRAYRAFRRHVANPP